ncbi:hypothetical protein [Sphingobium chlorophenolicum]|uniref:hypothetical protein n=1 Tax=Sphingobium chlorophenolicum TaxID=46429 RepID=UPI00117CD5A0|nr:hypothetical protein [Sphingobium chlorophenolicum]
MMDRRYRPVPSASHDHGEAAATRSASFLPDLLKALANMAAAMEQAKCPLDQASHDPLPLILREI